MTTYSSIQSGKSLSPSRNLLWNPSSTTFGIFQSSGFDTTAGGSTPELDSIFLHPGWNASSKNYGQAFIQSQPNQNYKYMGGHMFENQAAVTLSADSHLTYHTGFTFDDILSQDPNFGTALASPMTFSFWVKSNVVGAFICELTTNEYMYFDPVTGNPIQSRNACSLPYTINVANTWEYKTLTYPGYTFSYDDMFQSGYMSVNFWLASGTDYKSGGNLNSSGWTNIYDQSGNWPPLPNNNRAVGLTTDFASNTIVSDPNQPWITNAYWNLVMPQLECSPVATPFSIAPDKTSEKSHKSLYRAPARAGLPGGVMGDHNTNSTYSFFNHPKNMGMFDIGFAQTKSMNHINKDTHLFDWNGLASDKSNGRVVYEAQNGMTSNQYMTVNYIDLDYVRSQTANYNPGLHRGTAVRPFDNFIMMNSMNWFNLSK